MDYKQGFEDAIEMFERSIQKTLLSNDDTLDNIIKTLYVAKLKLDMLEDYKECKKCNCVL